MYLSKEKILQLCTESKFNWCRAYLISDKNDCVFFYSIDKHKNETLIDRLNSFFEYCNEAVSMKFKVNPTDHDTQAVVYEYKPAFAASHAHEAVALHGVVDEAKLRKSIMVEVKAEFERKEEREKLESAWDEIKEERERLKNWANKLSIVAESVLMNLVAKSPMLQGLLAGNMAPAPVLQGVPQTENEEQNSMTNEEVQRINNAVNKILMHFTVPEFEAAAEFLTKNVDMSKNFIKPLIK